MTTDNSTDRSITPAEPHGEGMSALFDGQLRDDAGRFAIRRLAHDVGWREACGRWQLAGDVLRGQAVDAAPGGFAEGIASAVASESADQAASPAAVSAGGRRGWLAGGALAASVAVAALLVVRPSLDTPREPVAGDGVAATSETRAGGAVATPSDSATRRAPVGTSAAPPAAVASVPQAPMQPVPVKSAGPRIASASADPASRSRSAVGRVATASQGAVPPVERVPSAPTRLAARPDAAHPFRPQPGEIVTRPWPGKSLMGGSADGAFTVSYDLGRADGTSPQRSFYPFEPVVPAALQSRQRQPSILRARQLIRARALPAVEGPPSR